MMRQLSSSAMGLVTGSSRQTFLGSKNRKHAFPDPNSFASLMCALDLDCKSSQSGQLSLVLSTITRTQDQDSRRCHLLPEQHRPRRSCRQQA